MVQWHSPLVYLVRIPKEGNVYQRPDHALVQVVQQSTRLEEVAPTLLADALLKQLSADYDSLDPHFANTAKRWVASMKELMTPEPFNFTTFPATSDEMVVLSPIPFYTMCAHHVIPFYGRAHVGYVPRESIAGLSKFGRLVKNMAKGLWVQEDLTAHVADKIEAYLDPRGVAVILEGEHMCMSMRGVQMPGVVTTTSAMRGVFGDHTRTAKAEFLQVIAPRRNNG